MGTSLTGLTPATTYDALIKVGDNGPLSATAKVLSDGLGNDSVLALSTERVGIGTTSPSSTFKLTVNSGSNVNSFLNGDKISFSRTSDNATDVTYLSRTNDLGVNGTANIHGYDGIQFRTQGPESVKATITSAGNVGIGTSSPTAKLHIQGSIAGASPAALLRVGNNGVGNIARIILTDETTADGNIVLKGDGVSAANQYIGFGLGSALDTLKLTGDNYLRMASGTGGIQFNGDTAAANALDDYEEGTFTATITGGTFSGLNSGVYTKIGRQVYWYLSPALTAITGNLVISGLPFTNGDRSASVFATVPPAGVTYLPAFHNSSSASCDVNVSGTYSGGAVSTYFAGVYSV